MSKYNYLIVGSGLFGSVFAQQMTASGKTCLIVEKRDHLGGNIYCKNVQGITVHEYGAHIFHTSDKKVWNYVNQFVAFNHYINSPIANYHGEIYNLPFNMNTFSKMWGIKTPAQAKAIIEEQTSQIKGEPANLEEQAISLVGQDIYEKLIKGYTEKQWGRDCKDLPAFIIKRLPVRYTYDNNYFNDCYQGIPQGGYNVLIKHLLNGCDLRLKVDFLKEKQTLARLADKIVYTGTIDSFYNYQFGALEYRSVRFESQVLNEQNHQGVAVVNYTDRETPFTRVIEHKHFEFGRQPNTVVTKEYSADWKLGDEPYYPVNDDKNHRKYEQYKVLAQQEPNVIFGGRLAEYQYYDMDKVIAAALKAAEKELFGK